MALAVYYKSVVMGGNFKLHKGTVALEQHRVVATSVYESLLDHLGPGSG